MPRARRALTVTKAFRRYKLTTCQHAVLDRTDLYTQKDNTNEYRLMGWVIIK